MLIKNGQHFTDNGFTHDNTQYPANYAAQHRDEWDALGITEVIPDPQPDPRWNISTLNWATGKWTSTPRDLGEVKERLVREAKQTAFSLLAHSDWRIVKMAETEEPCREDYLDYREQVRARCNEIEENIDECETLDELKEVGTADWPESPEAKAARGDLTITDDDNRATTDVDDQE